MRKANEILNNFIQVGLIVKDLDTTLANLGTILGMEEWRIAEYPPVGEPCKRMYQGKNGDFVAKFCFFEFNNIEFEVIQPLEGENIWDDFLMMNNGVGLHHMKFLVDSHEETDAHFASLGIEKIQAGDSVGKNAGKSWSFFDTFKQLGFYVETMNKLPK